VDTDGDGMNDLYELTHPCLNVGAQDSITDFDVDTLLSLTESQLLTDACAADTDGDLMLDPYEVQYSACLLPILPDGFLDPDGDTLTNVEEYGFASSPCDADTDGDGYEDDAEVAISKSPTFFCAIMRADVNHSSIVNVIDLMLTAQQFGPVPPQNERMDQQADAHINVLDLRRIAIVVDRRVSQCE
jgi:hypothetical protein